MSQTIIAQPLTRSAFAPFGEVIEKDLGETRIINDGKCVRHHDLAKIDLRGASARPVISIFAGTAYDIPLELKMVERHPLGSQAFIPLHDRPFLVIVCPSDHGTPGTPVAFLTHPGQGVSFPPGQWHGVLTPIVEDGDFLVIDRDGEGDNPEEHYFDKPYTIALP